jgi:hypothetical protein
MTAPDPNRELTPALIRGSRGSVTPLRTLELAPGLEGQLCHHVFASAKSRRESTVVLTEVPEGVAFAPALVCRDRGELGGGAPAQLPTEQWQPTELESTVFNHRYRLLSLAGQDPVYVREVFSPALIAWLAHDVPAGFSFELNERHLVVALPGHLDAEGQEQLCALAAEVGRRLREEAEEEGLASGLFDEAEKRAAIEAALTKVSFKRPPASVGAALEAFRHAARWRPTVVLSGVVCAVLGFFVGAAVGLLFYGPLGVAGGLLTLSGGFALGREIAGYRYSWGPISAQRLALEAFLREYARSHGLREADRWRFHSAYRHLPLPGVAAHVMAGPIPGCELGGFFLTLGDAAELRARGEEIAYASDRPLASMAVVIELEDEAEAERVVAVAGRLTPPEGRKASSLEREGATVAIWRPVQGSMLFTAKGFDAFRAEAGGLLAQVGEDREDAAVTAVAVA